MKEPNRFKPPFPSIFCGTTDEETTTAVELKTVANVIQEIERCVRDQDVEADGGAHKFKGS